MLGNLKQVSDVLSYNTKNVENSLHFFKRSSANLNENCKKKSRYFK